MNETADVQIERLHGLIVELKERETLQAVDGLLKAGVDPEKVINCFHRGLSEIGRLFQAKEYYMASLVLGGELMREAMNKMILPRLAAKEGSRKFCGKVVTATIEGDIHDLGKILAGFLLTANNFEVIDLGVDVQPRVILAETLRLDPVAVGVSLLLTASVPATRRLASLFKETYGDEPDRPLLLAGCAMGCSEDGPRNLKEWLGVDAVAEDASATVRLCQAQADLRLRLKGGTPRPA
jgi:methanogenic corrinoid protein MtbC1